MRTGGVLGGSRARGGVGAGSTHDASGVSSVAVSLAVEVGVDTGISLVGHVAVVRAGVGAVADTTSGAGVVVTGVVASVCAGQSTAVVV